jgi:FAD/FMN-containing dehydrogenase
VPRYRRLTAASRARLPLGLWSKASSRILGASFGALERSRAGRREQPLFDALFPFARRGEYLRLYGRRGLAEHQSLVPHAAASDFLVSLEREVRAARPPIVMGSLKLFRGDPRFVRFEGDGVCVTLDLVRSTAGLAFMDRLDRLTLQFGALPHLVKDSRVGAEVAARSYPGYAEFRERRRAYDPDGRFRSTHQARLGL